MATESFTDMAIDFSDLTDDEVESYRAAALVELTSRGEKAQFFRQAEAFVSTAFNRGYDKQEVLDGLSAMVDKIYEPPAE